MARLIIPVFGLLLLAEVVFLVIYFSRHRNSIRPMSETSGDDDPLIIDHDKVRRDRARQILSGQVYRDYRKMQGEGLRVAWALWGIVLLITTIILAPIVWSLVFTGQR